ncbi:MAG: cation diffusion facilitator family transporter [Neisseria sp.]|uniref:cation diffusion facilitator family transporter n=1 Tax=Neisseria sp. TaxID=192066 RepID=UPI0026DD5A55|nr:cation diffusion facilitator family transporter [Neisseria sp.]MDO4640145.1 cation diffusion facilitator family transporter [Neisseria sp.]
MPHDHAHHHEHSRPANKQVLRVSLVVIAAFMVVEIIGGWLTNSLALLSDAGHMFSDALSLGISLLALKMGERAVSRRNTFGYKRFEILAAAFNGLTLLFIALLIAYEAIDRFVDPPQIATTGMLMTSVLGLAVNIWVAWYMLKNSDTEENINMRSAYLHVLGDLFGSLGAIAAAILMMAFGWRWADPLASLLVAGLIAASGWGVIRNAAHILMEGTPADMDLDRISAAILETEAVEAVHDLHIWSISSGLHALSCHIVVDGNLSVAQAEQIVEMVAHRLKHENISHITVQTESRAHGHSEDLLCDMPQDEHHH